MNVLIVCDVLGEENNGTTIAAMNLIRYLKSQGDNVRILCADQEKKNVEDYYVVPNLNLGFIINKIVEKNDVTLAKADKKIINAALDGVDIVHVMMPFHLGVTTCKIARKRGIPVTAGFHCQAENFSSHIAGTMNSKLFNNIVYKTFYKNLYSRVNAIHYPTTFIKELFETTVKRNTNAYVISNGVNDLYKKTNVVRKKEYSKKYNIIFIGRLSKEKSHSLLIKAVSKSKHKDDIQLIFAGKGPREKQLLDLAAKYKINKPIINFFSRKELINIINSCDLYVHPAEIEIESIACLEAIKCGLVPIVSDSKRSATKAFALTDKNIFKHYDPNDLAEKIDYWYENPEKKIECAKKYEGFANHINQTECMKQMRNMLLTYSKPINHTNKTTVYYRDEVNDDFANNGIVAKQTPSNYKYIHTNPIYKLFEFLLYFVIAKPLIFLMNKLIYKQKIISHLTMRKKDIKGCFIYANHTLDMGDAYTPNLIFNRKNNIIVNPAAISIPGIRTIVGMLGALPLPSNNFESIKKYRDSINELSKKGQSITIYPEAHIWPYYTGIRNYSSMSFCYPIDCNKPAICVTNTFVPKGKGYRLITHIDGPFYPDINIEKRKARECLRDEIYNTMIKRSQSIKQFEKVRYIDLNLIEEK